MARFDIIPVIDLKGGRAVRAVGGDRAQYQPLATPLCPDGDPLTAAAGLLDVCPSRMLYIADLDAIEGQAPQHAITRRLSEAFPDVALWVDDGFAGRADTEEWPLSGAARLVLGSESLASALTHSLRSRAGARTFRSASILPNSGSSLRLDRCGSFVGASILPNSGGSLRLDRCTGDVTGTAPQTAHSPDASPSPDVVLSLDFRGDRFLGPLELLAEPSLWPDAIIVMCLHSVGATGGPDFAQLTGIIQAAGNRHVYAAGGVRHIADIEALAAIGAAGVLVSSALHSGVIGRDDIRRFTVTRKQQGAA